MLKASVLHRSAEPVADIHLHDVGCHPQAASGRSRCADARTAGRTRRKFAEGIGQLACESLGDSMELGSILRRRFCDRPR